MIHISNYGAFSRGLSRFADLNGMIPQKDDTPEQFHYEASWDFDGPAWLDVVETWEEWVAECEAALAKAEAALGNWQMRSA